jgi:hypothetical protein
MATIKAIIKEREKNKQGLCNIKFRITHHNRKRYIATQYFVAPIQFAMKDGKVRNSHQNAGFINIKLQKIQLQYEKKMIEITERIVNMDIDKLVDFLQYKKNEIDFFYVYNLVILNFIETNHKSTAGVYQTTLNELRKFSLYMTKF